MVWKGGEGTQTSEVGGLRWWFGIFIFFWLWVSISCYFVSSHLLHIVHFRASNEELWEAPFLCIPTKTEAAAWFAIAICCPKLAARCPWNNHVFMVVSYHHCSCGWTTRWQRVIWFGGLNFGTDGLGFFHHVKTELSLQLFLRPACACWRWAGGWPSWNLFLMFLSDLWGKKIDRQSEIDKCTVTKSCSSCVLYLVFVILKILKWCSTVFDVLQCIPFNQGKWWQPRGDRQRVYRLLVVQEWQSCCYDFIWYLGSTHHPVTVTNGGSIGIPEPKNMICFLWLLLDFGEYLYYTGRIPHPKASMQAERRQLAVLLDAAACVTFPRCFWTTVPLFPPLGYQSWAHFLVWLKGGVFWATNFESLGGFRFVYLTVSSTFSSLCYDMLRLYRLYS